MTMVALGVIVGLLYTFQEKLIYFPSGYPEPLLAAVGPDVVRLDYTITVQQKQWKQTAFYVPPQGDPVRAPEFIWVCFNGNADTALGWLRFLETMDFVDTAFLLVDYPGYGLSEGRPSPETILQSSKSAVGTLGKWLKEQGIEGSPGVGGLGFSLGTGACMQWAASYPYVKRVILLAPYTSTSDMARKQMGWPLYLLLRHQFYSDARLMEMMEWEEAPDVAVVLGTRDSVIPPEMSRKLAGMDKRVQLIEIEGAGHNDLLSMGKDEIHRLIMRGVQQKGQKP